MGVSRSGKHFATLCESAAHALRPGVEALLLAAVALGVAQAGWTLLTPSTARATDNVSGAGNTTPPMDVADVQSPFAPDAAGMGASSHAIAAMLSSVQLNGVRMSDEPARSGAMFTLSDGGQRAFIIGQEITEGVTLADVSADHVVLSYEGGQRRLDMQTAPPAFSYARAMMGIDAAGDAEASPLAVEERGAVAAAVSETDRAWLASTLAQVEVREGRAYGWRIAEQAPQPVLAAGLRPGDVVRSVNGVGPDNLAGALAAAQSGSLALEVERAGQRITLSIQVDERT